VFRRMKSSLSTRASDQNVKEAVQFVKHALH